MYDNAHDNDTQAHRYRCHMRTRSGMCAQYDGHVDVTAYSDDPVELHRLAVAELRRTSFPDYSGAMWRLERSERLS